MPNAASNFARNYFLGGSGGGMRAPTTGFFSQFNAPQSEVSTQQVPQRDASFSDTGVGNGSGGAPLDVYGGGSPQAQRNLNTNPLTSGELSGLSWAQKGISMLPGGFIANQMIDHNLGLANTQDTSTEIGGKMYRDTLGYMMGVGEQNGLSPAEAAQFALTQRANDMKDSVTGFFGEKKKVDVRDVGDQLGYQVDTAVTVGDPMAVPKPLAATDYMGTPSPESPNVGYTAEANATPGDPMTNLMNLTNAYGTGGNGGSNQQSWGSSGDPEAAAAGDSAAYGYTGAPTGGYTGAPAGGYNTGLGSYGGSAWGGGSATTGGYGGGQGFADGGMVGLTGPMYSDQNQSPSSLAQMGFANGGAVGMGIPSGSMGPEQMQSQVAQMVRNPKFQQVVQGMVGAAMQSGELTPDELVMAGRIAEASMHNPSMYPKLRQFALQNGMAPLPDAFDPKVIMTIMAAAQLMGRTQPGQVPPTDVANMQNPTGAANGGFLKGPGTGRSDSIGTVEQDTGKPVKVANGEYVIPSHIVAAKGKDFFDKMLRQYAQLTPQE